jgi:hypothetical protein
MLNVYSDYLMMSKIPQVIMIINRQNDIFMYILTIPKKQNEHFNQGNGPVNVYNIEL